MTDSNHITVAICTYRRFDRLNNCLKSLKRQTLPQNLYELLIIDNSLTPEISREFRNTLRDFSNLNYIITDKCGIGYARNIALENCHTTFIAFTDDDCIVPDNWIQTYLDIFDSRCNATGVIGGRVNPNWGKQKPDWLTGEFLDCLAVLDWGDTEQFINPTEGKWLLTANATYQTKALKQAGGFAEHLGRKKNIPMAQEEFAANLAIFKSGFDLLYTPEISVEHAIDESRMTQRWQCIDAFWYAVSSELTSCQTVNLASVEKALEPLSFKIDNYLKDWKEDVSLSTLKRKVADYREKGCQAAREVFQELTQNISSSHVLNIYQTWPVIYITTPCLNSVDTIDRCILNVASQAGDFCIRYHVQDGGSKDGTIDKLKRWEILLEGDNAINQCHNIVFTWESSKDKGMYNAIHESFARMCIPQHAYMTWINSDDILMPGALATVAKIASKLAEKIHWLCGYTAKFKDNRPITIKPRILNRDMIQMGLHDGEHLDYLQQEGTFFKKWLWDKGKYTLETFSYAGDWNLWRVFAKHAHIYQAPFPLACFSIRPGQLSQINRSAYQAEINATIPLQVRQKAFRRARKRLNSNFGIIDIDPDNGRIQATIQYYGFFFGKTSEHVTTTFLRLKTWLARILPAFIKRPLKAILERART